MIWTPETQDTQIQIIEQTPKMHGIGIELAQIVVAVGRGIKDKRDLALAEEFAHELGGVTACTRPLVEMNWYPRAKQIGVSGKKVAPRLLFCIGISGSIQFVAGIQGAQHVIAINSDPDAPIFQVAHQGFVGDLYEILPQLTERIRKGEFI